MDICVNYDAHTFYLGVFYVNTVSNIQIFVSCEILDKLFLNSLSVCVCAQVYVYVYVTVNLYNQVICILPDFFS